MKEGWEYKKLGEVCSIERGGSPRPISDYITDAENGINWIKIGDAVEGSKYIMSTAEKIKPEGMKKSRLVHKGDFILSNSMSFGKPYILGVDGCIHDGWLVIHDDSNTFNKDFLYYYLGSPTIYSEFKRLAVGGVVNNLNSNLVRGVKVAIPPLSQQQHIVEELDLLSSIIEKKKAQLNELDNMAQSLFYEMFGESSNWECKQLKEITTKMGSGATPRGGNQSYKEDGVSLIRSLNVHNGHFKYDDLAHIDEQQASQLDNVTIKENDVLLNITGASVARCCIVPTDILPARVNQHVSILRVKETLLNSTYLCHCLISPNSQAELLIMSKSNAATREALPKATLEKYLVPIPPLDLQNQFAEKVQAIEHQKELIEKSIKEVETLFNSRMDYYFN